MNNRFLFGAFLCVAMEVVSMEPSDALPKPIMQCHVFNRAGKIPLQVECYKYRVSQIGSCFESRQYRTQVLEIDPRGSRMFNMRPDTFGTVDIVNPNAPDAILLTVIYYWQEKLKKLILHQYSTTRDLQSTTLRLEHISSLGLILKGDYLQHSSFSYPGMLEEDTQD